ncbi:MAG: HAD family hydrolase, partial [Thermosynechococcaceae cyanobacterium]
MSVAPFVPDALALDFDGVLCDGLKEYFQTALNAYGCFWSHPEAEVLPRWESTFGRLRPVVETGWEMPLVLRALDRGWSEAAILSDWPQIRETILSQESITASQLGAQVDGLRDQWIATDLSSWLALHRFYPGVSGQLHRWVKQQFPIFIVT